MLTTTHRRIALYGRHSTAMQSASSSADQVASCAPLVGYLGGTVTATWLDPELSGYRRDRPGLRQLLRAVETGQIDIIVCEALDRLARDAEDVAWLGKKLAYHRVQLHTVSEGHVDEIKFAVAGLLSSIFLKHLVDKTLRGMEAAVLAGRFAGGRAYGYKRMVRLDAKGEVQRGFLEIEERQAAVVRRIFAWFAAGLSSIQIATRLNEEGFPARVAGSGTPRRSAVTRPSWSASSITRSTRVGWCGAAGNGARTRTAKSANAATGSAIVRNGSRWRCPSYASLTTRCSTRRTPRLSAASVRHRQPRLQARPARGICSPALSAAAVAVPITRSAARTITAARGRRSAARAETACRYAKVHWRPPPWRSFRSIC
ncbi:recombinase family protein [Sphingomonas aerolata]|uniref:recombinase family protein n=1 Tax=Sphingomonas aerolata TaxID=185951 RepID=UPI003A5BD8EE